MLRFVTINKLSDKIEADGSSTPCSQKENKHKEPKMKREVANGLSTRINLTKVSKLVEGKAVLTAHRSSQQFPSMRLLFTGGIFLDVPGRYGVLF